jgi:hypothetical protein
VIVNTWQPRGASPEEQKLLDQIKQATGLTFRHLGSIDTQQKSLASAVLPVLVEQAREAGDFGLRAAIYMLFATKHARPWVETIINWWTAEQDPIALSVLTMALSRALDRQHAGQVWGIAKSLPWRPNLYLLLTSLTRFSSIADQVKEFIWVNRRNLRPGDVVDVSRVKDERIRAWCREQKFLRFGLPCPEDSAQPLRFRLERSSRLPNRSSEWHSTEIDLRDLEKTIGEFFRKANLDSPNVTSLIVKVIDLPIDRWFKVRFTDARPGWPTVWLRLEDVDTVEIVFERS